MYLPGALIAVNFPAIWVRPPRTLRTKVGTFMCTENKSALTSLQSAKSGLSSLFLVSWELSNKGGTAVNPVPFLRDGVFYYLNLNRQVRPDMGCASAFKQKNLPKG